MVCCVCLGELKLRTSPRRSDAMPSLHRLRTEDTKCAVCAAAGADSGWNLCPCCVRWFHGACIGYKKPEPGVGWYCSYCATSFETGEESQLVVSRAASAPSTIATMSYAAVLELAVRLNVAITADRDAVRRAVVDRCSAMKVV